MERQRILTDREKRAVAEERKRLLAKSILVHIRYELSQQPEAEAFTYPLKSSVGKLERFVLSHYPQDIAERIGASVSLELDESVVPPLLTVSIGQPKKRD